MTNTYRSMIIILGILVFSVTVWYFFIPTGFCFTRSAYYKIGKPFKIIESKHNSGEVFKVFSKIPIKWKLEREKYTVTLVQGDRWYPRLYANVKDVNQNNFNIISPGMVLLQQPHMLNIETNYQGEEVRYWVKACEHEVITQQCPENNTIEIEIRKDNGELLGKETIHISFGYGYHLAIDSI